MSRSHYIYTVQDPVGLVLGAFTVKHELKRALGPMLAGGSNVGVTRMKDGYLGEARHPVVLDPQSLEPLP